jgi:plastocyanin
VRVKASLLMMAVLGVAAATALSPASVSGADTATAFYGKRIAVEDNFFDPRSLNLRRGEIVRWRWYGENSHNVTFVKVPRGASRRGADSRTRGRFKRSFWKRGVYKYICTNHDGMVGTLYVH